MCVRARVCVCTCVCMYKYILILSSDQIHLVFKIFFDHTPPLYELAASRDNILRVRGLEIAPDITKVRKTIVIMLLLCWQIFALFFYDAVALCFRFCILARSCRECSGYLRVHSRSTCSSLVPGGGGGESTWCILFAHARNYSKSHVVGLGTGTNMTINGSHEQHKPS